MINREEFLKSLMPIEQELLGFYKKLLSKHQPGKILEVGSGWGLFTRACIEWTKGHVVTIDKITGGYGLPQFKKHTEGFEDRFTRVEGDSQKILPGWEDAYKEHFDFIFVDADHGQDGASKDLKYSWPLLRKGGLLMVDDVFHKENYSYVEKDKCMNFGVGFALWGFMQAHKGEFASFPEIAPYAHGVVVIKKALE